MCVYIEKPLIDRIEDMQEEWIREDGFVSIESHVHDYQIEDVKTKILSVSDKLSEDTAWIIFNCETCVEYHGPDNRHIAIEKIEYINKWMLGKPNLWISKK